MNAAIPERRPATDFLLILKLRVWLRTHIERKTPLGRLAAKAFWKIKYRKCREA
jgi:hypothetical protein